MWAREAICFMSRPKPRPQRFSAHHVAARKKWALFEKCYGLLNDPSQREKNWPCLKKEVAATFTAAK